MMPFIRLVIVALTATVAPGVALSMTYTVPTDFGTIQAALNAAVPGDTINVLSGVYSEKLTFASGGTLVGGYITLQAAPGNSPVLDGTAVSGANMVLIEDKSYVKVIGFEMQNNLGVNDGSGVRILGAGSNIEIRDNRIHDMRGLHAMGITVYGTDPLVSISNLIIDGNEVYDSEPATSEAITLNGNVELFVVTNNYVHDVNNIGIDFIGGETDIQPDPSKVARNGICKANRVERARSTYGGGFAGGIYVDGGDDIVIEGNFVTECDLGIEIGAENAGQDTTGILVRDNVVYRNDKVGLVFGGFSSSVGRTKNCSFTNNTFYQNDTLGEGLGEIWIQFAENNVLRNNIAYSTAQNVLIYSEGGNVNNTFDYNLFYADAGAAAATFVWQGTVYSSFASYQSGSSQDSSSLFANPQFFAPGAANFHLKAISPAINAGDPAFVLGVGEADIDAAPRLNGPRVDIGADELNCGDGITDPGEQCDDGDLNDCDGCDSNCTVSGCGNSIVCAPEQCDDGNLTGGDCCSGACLFEAPLSVCDDANLCTVTDTCDGAGLCSGLEQPDPTCMLPTTVGGSKLLLKDSANDASDKLVWKWGKGAATTSGDLGDPTSSATDYALCIYDEAAGVPSLEFSANIPGGVTCGGDPCWKVAGPGFKYKDSTRSRGGIQTILLRPGDAGKAKIVVKGKGLALLLPGLPFTLDPAVTVQLKNSDGVCWQAEYGAPATNTTVQFKDTSN